jgi:hypothetical protein
VSSLVVGVPHKSIVYTSGTPKLYNDRATASGRIQRRFFCADCGTPITSWPEGQEVSFVKVALFDGAPIPDVAGEIFWERAEGVCKALHGLRGDAD